MSRFPSLPGFVLFLLAAAPPARAQALLDVSGSVVSVAPRLEVRVVVTNRGDRPAGPLEVTGELFGERRLGRLAGGVPPGGEGAVHLEFDPAGARAGLHALTLLLEHALEGPPDGAGNPPMASERAWLLIALGGPSPAPAVRLAADPLVLGVEGHLAVRLDSADGERHRVRVRALTARGLRADGSGALVDVPAEGTASAALPLVRAGAPRGSRHAVVLVAEVEDGPVARTAVLAVPVGVAADPSLVARFRAPLFALGLALLAVALGFEVLCAFRRRNPAT